VQAVPLETARRFVLGRQGLWPGRRWKGPKGLDLALGYIGSVQFDPLDVVGPSHDLALWGRIDGYRAADLGDALYTKRTLFETGGNVQIRPIEELPYLRIVMRRRIAEERWRRFARTRGALLSRVTRELERRGPLGSGDFGGPGEKRIRNYRAGKESGLALYYLWLKGDVMIAFRRRGEKVFDLTDRLVPQSPPWRVAPNGSGTRGPESVDSTYGTNGRTGSVAGAHKESFRRYECMDGKRGNVS
jgi:uncharacterized protein